MVATAMEYIFWGSIFAIAYPYFIYPLLLLFGGRSKASARSSDELGVCPPISVVIPVHNEAKVIEAKLDNTLGLEYPPERLEIIVVSDGSTDGTNEMVRRYERPALRFLPLEERKGKGWALDVGVESAQHDIVVFSDASMMLEASALRNIVRSFEDPAVGTVSGEDHIPGQGGESLYGRYELFLRKQESALHSIVGASGSFYAQRKQLCGSFMAGMAPDFLSVLETVEQGFRAVSEPNARGTMTSLSNTRQEFSRKVRTVVRGLSTLIYKRRLLNPFRYGIFSFELWSHKVMRWLIPFFLVSAFLTNMYLISDPIYLGLFLGQVLFYGVAVGSFGGIRVFDRSLLGRFSLYFSTVNLAILVAWWRFFMDGKLEIWEPTKR